VTLAVGLASADARSGARRLFDEIASKGLPELAAAIPVGASVYWPEHLHLVWFGLERASYVSSYQLAGAVFSRKTAVEGARRIRNVERIGGSDVVVRARERDATAHRSRDVTDVEHACRDPRLDFVILDTDGDHPSRPGYRDARTGRTHWLYDCTHERRSKSKS